VQGSRSHRAELLPIPEEVWRPERRAGPEAQAAGAGEWSAEEAGGRPFAREAGPEGYCGGKLVSPERRRQAVDAARETYELSERTACRIVGQPR
jgi:hypothetical protein